MLLSSVAAQSGLVRLTDISVTTATDGNVTASANLYAGASATPVRVSVQYANASNWTINVQRNGAAPGSAPTSSTSLNVNQVDGTITKVNGYLTYQLVLHGYVPGDGTFDMTVRVEPEGFVATTVGEIFSGVITNWNDPRMRATNARHPMPKDLPITLCAPARPSGTSWGFSHYLTKVSGAFRERVGAASTLPRWKAPGSSAPPL
ncbi:MAG: hypothetical protein FJW92_05705 [Actinobacteria bacterium]|nr:hypothetical protein [Actinomycetota bacterium]